MTLQSVMKVLRSPEGCEWDRKQTHETLKKSLIEEAYEVNQAIDNDDIDETYRRARRCIITSSIPLVR